MQYRTKLYRSIAATALMLLAGLVLAPTIVTADFHAWSKKAAEPKAQLALETAVKPAERHLAHPRGDSRPEPLPIEPQTAPKQAAPQSEAELSHGQPHDSNGPTTFAVNDFAPAPHSFAVFPQGAAGIDIASNDAGGNITKIARKPKQPAQGNGPAAPETGSAPQDNTGKDKDGEQPAADTEHNTPSDTQYAGDHHDSRPQASVPEPSSIALLAAGLIGLVVARRRS